MTRHLLIFAATFALGGIIAVVLRTGAHRPYEERGGLAASASATTASVADPHADHGSASAPAVHEGKALPASPATAPEHAGHGHGAPPPAASASAAVNSNCPICGMPVDPKLGTIPYQGKEVGFGCQACPPKFRAEPQKYGEAALKNQVAE